MPIPATPAETGAVSPSVATLSDVQYHEAVQAALSRIERTVDSWLEDDVIDIDGARTGNMLTLSLPDRSQLIVNAQPPLQELWLAARRGGFHFKLDATGAWQDSRSGQEFFALLSESAAEQSRVTLQF